MKPLPFSGAFVINMEEARDRRARISLMLRRNGIPFEIMPAERSRHPDRKMAGILGCLWTHAKCVRAAKDMKWKSVLIMEDDAVLHPRFHELLPDLSQLDDLEWDVFYFYIIQDGRSENPPLKTPVTIRKIEYSVWSHFYAVHSRFYDEYLRIATTSNWYSDRLFRGDPFRLYGLSANLVGQSAGTSCIDGHHYSGIRGLSF